MFKVFGRTPPALSSPAFSQGRMNEGGFTRSRLN
jgi:hypothetical protein